ncbi:MAG: branched-chain amino acid ABC transporter substrate-binding protein [Elusimicrobia bacterium]|nr:branched-chain amino acid ABC transporter substrate-binding protein [Elusimicrobiota bacterium]
MRTRALLPALALLCGAFCACLGRSDTVRIAVAVPLTGDLSTEGQGIQRAVELAVAQAQAEKGLAFPVEVLAFDDRAVPESAVKAANLISADPRIAAVIGHFTSGCSIAAAPVYAAAGLAMISPIATNPKLTRRQLEPGWPGPRNVFRVTVTDDVQGNLAAEFAVRRLRLKRFFVVHDGTPYGQGLAEEFRARFKRLGGREAGLEAIEIGERDFKLLLARILEEKPDGVYFGGVYPEYGLLLKQARKLGLKTVFFSGDGCMIDALFDVAGDAAEGSYFTMPGRPLEQLPGSERFIQSYRESYPGVEIGQYDHFGYDAANIVLEALRQTGPVSGAGRTQLIEALRGIRHKGVLGVTTFDRKGDTTLKTVTITRAKGRQFVPVR